MIGTVSYVEMNMKVSCMYSGTVLHNYDSIRNPFVGEKLLGKNLAHLMISVKQA